MATTWALVWGFLITLANTSLEVVLKTLKKTSLMFSTIDSVL